MLHGVHLRSFILPERIMPPVGDEHTRTQVVVAIVPTYAPSRTTVALVQSLISDPAVHRVYVVDDCSPSDAATEAVFTDLTATGAVVLKTNMNVLKAGALNAGVWHMRHVDKLEPNIIITCDDDVIVTENTVVKLVGALVSDERLGAVCAQNYVLNKSVNVVTRLQGLEYLGFNVLRTADQGFMYGPLVMPGMLTAFRYDVLRSVGGFRERHLIEDYEITVRIKERGWRVRAAPHAIAWTEVPTSIKKLWKQRVRWTYGGIQVLGKTKNFAATIQDWIGHTMFVVMFALIVLTLIFRQSGNGAAPTPVTSWVIYILVTVAVVQFILWYSFSLWSMRLYPGRDRIDWLLRATILPELLYSLLLTGVVLGSYAFYIFNWLEGGYKLGAKRSKISVWTIELMRGAFARIGFASTWGTR